MRFCYSAVFNIQKQKKFSLLIINVLSRSPSYHKRWQLSSWEASLKLIVMKIEECLDDGHNNTNMSWWPKSLSNAIFLSRQHQSLTYGSGHNDHKNKSLVSFAHNMFLSKINVKIHGKAYGWVKIFVLVLYVDWQSWLVFNEYMMSLCWDYNETLLRFW